MPPRLPAPPLLVAHRGASERAPENTFAACEAAAAAGAHFVELDVRLAADGALVVIHDATLERTTDGSGRVSDHDAAQLAALDAGGWFADAYAGEPVPVLEELLPLLAELDFGVTLEFKAESADEAAEVARAFAALVERHAAPGQPEWPEALLLSALEPAALEVCAALLPELPRALVLERPEPGSVTLAVTLGCAQVHVDHRALTAAFVAEARAADLLVGAFTVNDPDRAEQLWEAGVTTVFSDVPDLPAVPSGAGPEAARRRAAEPAGQRRQPPAA